MKSFDGSIELVSFCNQKSKNLFCCHERIVSWATHSQVGLTRQQARRVEDCFMPVVAYTEVRAEKAGAAAQVGLACRLVLRGFAGTV